ncbi:sugar-binding transcriptional regulator [Loigolactobacillus backii]|uniref:SorC family transcriptional regulator n=1 Tax=Loigolactobacillus backii TaxID=375175 RepID=A0A192H507_9LACO|nr:sugar-binding domain-containing protein [Loigolactobacillus backii]ANK59962.1 SorC family transcriptional regulator [Loigolactobacillus backii]ANK63297.1 SorC family transcriptional regulator [Loigolactobacillus backii]ANK64896.1 SorC family transcriptional regulator [Loigolactobacillus backii]ANK66657.1 SorC family transcriptional regulator [Loigolactobacillus backii]ANK69698.1 SorC family transcriptional regulator [Loigolactobacillus backii]
MHQDLARLEALAPDLILVAKLRYQILQNIYWMAPVGRRVLAQKIGKSERVLRTETDFLRAHNLLSVTKSGMVLTQKGQTTFQGLEAVMDNLLGVRAKEQQLSAVLQIDHCLIVPGDSDQQTKVLDDMGKLVSETLDLLLPNGDNIIAAMGGTTMAKIADTLSPKLSAHRKLTFVPARGGLGEAVDIQANAVCARMAFHTGGQYRVLYIPEHVSERAYRPLLEEPAIKDVLALVDKSASVVHSIGVAALMAKRRNMPLATIKMLEKEHAVGEAFGYFFDASGRVIYKIPRIGLQLRDLQNIPCVVAVAGGQSKAVAIKAYTKLAPKQTWLITDEGAANLILKGVTL